MGALLASAAAAQTVTRESVSTGGTEGNKLSSDAIISYTGRYLVFDSDATNLVAVDTNLFRDVFLKDTQTGSLTMISVSSAGVQGNALSSVQRPGIVSDDGQFVAFYSSASNLVAGDTNLVRDVFLRDTVNSTTTMVSVSTGGVIGNALSSGPSMSGDGKLIAFYSSASNLIAGDTNLVRDVFLRNLTTNTTTRVSVSSAGVEGNGESSGPVISHDGRYVAFYSSATNLVGGDTNAFRDCFVRDLQTNTTTRVSVSTAGVQGDKLSSDPCLSADGRYVAFYSDATNLVSGDTNAVRDVFLRDRQLNTTIRVSLSTGNVQGNARSETQAISGDGKFVAFDSDATNLVAGDVNLVRDTFLRDVTASTTILVNADANGVHGNATSANATLSSDGKLIAFGSNASNLVAGDTNLVEDIFLRDQNPGCPAPIVYCTAKVNSLACTPSISLTGSVSASAGTGATLTTVNVIGNKNGLYFHSTSGQIGAPFHGGFLCVKSPTKRHAIKTSGGTGGTCTGVFTEDLNAYIASGADPALVAGANIWIQCWSRDPGDAFTDSLSDAVKAVVCP
jgi:Tol biopolymer transport system component